MPEDEIITFEAYYDPMLAQIIKGRLEANGISCYLADETTIGVNPLYSNAIGGVKLKIFAKDEARCREILAEDVSDVETGEVVSTETDDVCPFCSSSNIKYGLVPTDKTDWKSLVFSFLTFVPIRTQKSWHCYNCGENFAEANVKPDLQ
jgi:hypothetical protein